VVKGVLAIKSSNDDNKLLISVSDTGVGFSLDQGEQIFSAFFTTKEHGTGMGLPISRSIIESHGGPIVGHWFARARCNFSIHAAEDPCGARLKSTGVPIAFVTNQSRPHGKV